MTKWIFFKVNKYGNLVGVHWKRLIGAIICLIVFIFWFFGSQASAGTGEALLIIHPLTNSITGPIRGPTWGFYKNPFLLEQTITIPYYIDSLGMWGNGTDKYADFPSVPCFSKDQLEMQIDIMIRWSLDPSKLVEVFNKYPNLDFKTKVIASIAREQMRIITSTRYTAIETIEKRGIIANEIKNAIWDKLSSEPTLYGAILNFEFDLRNIGYPSVYTEAIQAKLAAEQQMRQAEFEKQRIIVMAQADAEKVTINAQAIANATVIQAMGKADAIELIANQTGISSEDLVKTFLWLQTLSDLKPQFIYIAGNDGTFIYPLNP